MIFLFIKKFKVVVWYYWICKIHVFPTKRAVGPIIHQIGCIVLRKESGGDTPASPATILYTTEINV